MNAITSQGAEKIITSQKVNNILKSNGLEIAKRNGGQGWTTTEKAGFSSQVALDSVRVTFHRASANQSVSRNLDKAIKVLEMSGLQVEYTKGNDNFYVKEN